MTAYDDFSVIRLYVRDKSDDVAKIRVNEFDSFRTTVSLIVVCEVENFWISFAEDDGSEHFERYQTGTPAAIVSFLVRPSIRCRNAYLLVCTSLYGLNATVYRGRRRRLLIFLFVTLYVRGMRIY